MSRPPVAFSINHEGLILDIALVEIDRLLIHEETIPYRLNKLKKSIQCDGVQSSPVLVDRNTFVVLDGMHRIAALRELGCRFTCVCLLDYFDPSITVQRWCRIIPAPFNVGNAEKLLYELDLKLEPYKLVEGSETDGSLLLIFKDNTYRIITNREDLVSTVKKSYMLERKLEDWGYKIHHCTELEAEKQLTSGSYEATIYLPKVDKEHVVKVAKEKRIFSPKATRHRLPARPVTVNVPLNLLKDTSISIEGANRKLADHLSNKNLTSYYPGVEWMGRTYDEVLYVFSDPEIAA